MAPRCAVCGHVTTGRLVWTVRDRERVVFADVLVPGVLWAAGVVGELEQLCQWCRDRVFLLLILADDGDDDGGRPVARCS